MIMPNASGWPRKNLSKKTCEKNKKENIHQQQFEATNIAQKHSFITQGKLVACTYVDSRTEAVPVVFVEKKQVGLVRPL